MAKKKEEADFGLQACADISYKLVEICIEAAKNCENENEAYVFSGIDVIHHLHSMLPKLTAAFLKEYIVKGLNKMSPIGDVAYALDKLAKQIDADIAKEELAQKKKASSKKPSSKKSAAKKTPAKKPTKKGAK